MVPALVEEQRGEISPPHWIFQLDLALSQSSSVPDGSMAAVSYDLGGKIHWFPSSVGLIWEEMECGQNILHWHWDMDSRGRSAAEQRMEGIGCFMWHELFFSSKGILTFFHSGRRTLVLLNNSPQRQYSVKLSLDLNLAFKNKVALLFSNLKHGAYI